MGAADLSIEGAVTDGGRAVSDGAEEIQTTQHPKPQEKKPPKPRDQCPPRVRSDGLDRDREGEGSSGSKL